jgi:tetratricopeptide (TPR) repeat protein
MEEYEECHENCDNHDHAGHIKYRTRWIFSLIFIPVCIFLIKPLVSKQVLYRASAYRASYMYQDSIRQYRKGLFIGGDNSDAWMEMGDVYKLTEDVEKAISSYRRAIEIDPHNRKALYSLGITLALKKQQYEEAKKYWDKVRELGPESAEERAKYILSYHRQSLLSLVTYYRRMNEPDGEVVAQEELNRYYPDTRDAGEDNPLNTGAREGTDTSP